MRFSESASGGGAYVIGVREIIPSMAERCRSYAESACHAEKGTCKESLCVMKTSGGGGDALEPSLPALLVLVLYRAALLGWIINRDRGRSDRTRSRSTGARARARG